MPRWQTARSTAPVSTSGTAFVDAPELTFDAEANAVYAIRLNLPFETAATTTGIKFGLNGPGGFTMLLLDRFYMTSLTASIGQFSRAYNTGGPSTQVDAAAPSDQFSVGGALLANVTAGPVVVRFGSEVNLSQVTILANALLQYRKVSA